MKRGARFVLTTVGGGLLLAYAVPLLVPPDVPWPLPMPADAGLWERIFPGIPPWWVAGRLACLLAGALLVAATLRGRVPLRIGRPAAAWSAGEETPPWARGVRWLALGLAFVHAVTGLWAADFGRGAEVVYFFFLGVPALLVAATEPVLTRRIGRTLAAELPRLLVVPAVWLLWALAVAWRSPRAASIVDGWLGVERLEQVAQGLQKTLADSAIPGFTNAHMMLEGVFLFGPDDFAALFAWIQGVHFFWTVVAAVGVGVLVWKTVGRDAAVVGQAVFLFSPFATSCAYTPLPMYLMPLCSVSLLLLFLAVHRTRSLAALAAFGALAGFAGRIPQQTLAVALLGVLVLHSLWRAPRRPWLVIGVAALTMIAAALPGLPSPEMFTKMRSEYTGAQGQYLGVEMILFGRRSFWYTEQALTAGRASGIDVPLGALLTPFAIVRTPLRLWGDTLFDPFGGALIAVGLAACVRRRPTRSALLVLGLVAAGGALALASAGDRVSHTRMIAAVVPLVLFAAAGFEVLRRSLPGLPSGVVTSSMALVVMLAGVVLFDRVGPRILPASAVEVALETRAATATEPDAVLLHHAPPWMHDERIAAQLPARPLPTVAYPTFAAEDLWAETMPARVYFWSPALDQVSNVTNTFCDHWPDVALYAIRDGTASVAVFAAAPAAAGWQPGLPAWRWTTVRCS